MSFLLRLKKSKPDLTKLNNCPVIKNSLSEKLQIALTTYSIAELMSLEGALKNSKNPSIAPRNCALYLKTFYQLLKKHKSSCTAADKQIIAMSAMAIIIRVSIFLNSNSGTDLSAGNANDGLIGVSLMLSFNKNKTIANYPSTYVKQLSSQTGISNIKQAWNNLIDKYNLRVVAFEKEFSDYNKNHPQQLITQGKKA